MRIEQGALFYYLLYSFPSDDRCANGRAADKQQGDPQNKIACVAGLRRLDGIILRGVAAPASITAIPWPMLPPLGSFMISVFSLRLNPQTEHSSCFKPYGTTIKAGQTKQQESRNKTTVALFISPCYTS